MWFFWFVFFTNLLYPLAMIIGGWFLWKHCPAKITDYCGYRSHRSKLNQDTWRFANEHCGKRWWKLGWVMLVPAVLSQIPFYGRSEDALGLLSIVWCVVGCSVMIFSILPTEKALRETFDERGNRR